MQASSACRVFPRVGQQVLQRLAHQRRVTGDPQAVLDLHTHLAGRRAAPKIVHDVQRKLRQIHRLACQRLGGQAGQRQHGIDHRVHARGRTQHPVQVVVAHAIELPAVVLLQDAREAFHHPQRCAQVMGDRVAEGGRLVGG